MRIESRIAIRPNEKINYDEPNIKRHWTGIDRMGMINQDENEKWNYANVSVYWNFLNQVRI